MPTCFVIMGFATKKIPNTNIEVDLDNTYKKLIKPVLIEMGLVAVNCTRDLSHSYRCDEIYTTQAINETFIKNIYDADIVVADITALNQNAIYELGMRHAMKPKSTIILCDNKTAENTSFFDLTFNPQIKYDSIDQEVSKVDEFKKQLKNVIKTCIESSSDYIDSPVFRLNIYDKSKNNKQTVQKLNQPTLAQLLAEGQHLIEEEKYAKAEKVFNKIIYELEYTDIQVYCSYILSMYKKKLTKKNLKKSLKSLKQLIDLETTTYEDALGIAAAIHLRLFSLNKVKSDLYSAIDYYRKGSYFESGDLYCGKNYCSTLLKIYLIEDQPNILKEYYYTAVHTAKMLLTKACSLKRDVNAFNNAWFLSNQNSLFLIATGIKSPLYSINYQSPRQKTTIEDGMQSLCTDIEQIRMKAGIF